MSMKMMATERGTLLRLNKSHPEGWRWFPVFEARVVEWAARMSPWMNGESIKTFLEQRWLTMPLSLGAWLYLDENESPIGHACAYISTDWGVVSIVVFQVAANDGERVTDAADLFLCDLATWRRDIDEAYAAASPDPSKRLKVERVVMFTERDTAWCRYLRTRLPVKRTLTELEIG